MCVLCLSVEGLGPAYKIVEPREDLYPIPEILT